MVASSSKGSEKRELIPLTPEILLLLLVLESDKGKQAKLLTEHMTSHRVLPSTKEDLIATIA